MSKTFSDWLQEKIKNEEATTTADVANFSMPIGGMVVRGQRAKKIKKINCSETSKSG